MRRFATPLLLGLFLLGFMLPGAKADMFDKKTILKVHERIQIPGQVLEPGTYVMKRTIPRMDPDIISFWTASDGFHEDHILATVKAIPVERPRATDKSVFEFGEARGTEPKALKVWYYPGEVTGAEFLYPKNQNLLAMNSEPEFIGGLAPKRETADTEISTPVPAPETSTEISTPVPEPQASAEPEHTTEIAQARPAPAANEDTRDTSAAPSTEPDRLPATGGFLPLLSLLGAAAAAGGAGLKKLCK